MLHWLPKERNKYIFFLELLLISMMVHGFVGILLFVVYQGSASSIHIDLGSSKVARPTLFMPLKKPSVFAGLSGGSVAMGKGNSGVLSGTGNRKAQTPVAAKRAGSRSSQTSLSHVVEQQAEKKSAQTTGKRSTKKVSKKNNKKQSKADIVKKLEKKSEPIAPKPVEKPIEKVLAKPTVVPPELPKPEQVSEKSQQKVEPEIQNLHQEATNEKIVEPLASAPLGESSEMVEQVYDDQIVNTDEYVSAEQVRMYEEIEREITSKWKAPKGLSKDLMCQIKVHIGSEGNVTECIVERPSGVLIYDMSARSASRAMKLPRWAWGKDITIAFKQ